MLDLKSAKYLTDFAMYSYQYFYISKFLNKLWYFDQLADVALWEYHVEDPAFMQLLKIKWRTYHVQYHPHEVCYTTHHKFTDMVYKSQMKIYMYLYLS